MQKGSILLAAAALVAIGCTAEKKAASDSTSGQVAQAGSSTPAVVTVHARDYAFDAPNQIPAGVTTFHLVNDGPGLHHMQLVRLDSGKTFADLEQALKKPGAPPGWIVFVGGPNAPDPHGESNATLDLKPGTYALLCMVDMPGGVPHFAKGMVHPLTVTADSSAAVAPAADVDIALQDYSFQLSKPLTAGTHVIALTNSSSQAHEVELVKLAPGKTVQDMLTWISKMQGPPPGSAVGGGAAIAPGEREQFKANLEPGNYALICFIPDIKDGKPHFVHGMVKDITIS